MLRQSFTRRTAGLGLLCTELVALVEFARKMNHDYYFDLFPFGKSSHWSFDEYTMCNRLYTGRNCTVSGHGRSLSTYGKYFQTTNGRSLVAELQRFIQRNGRLAQEASVSMQCTSSDIYEIRPYEVLCRKEKCYLRTIGRGKHSRYLPNTVRLRREGTDLLGSKNLHCRSRTLRK